jgi:DNA-binding NarL/FixJ family response regulator
LAIVASKGQGAFIMGSVFPNPGWRAQRWEGDGAPAPRRDRLVLVEPHGLLRDGLASLIAKRIPEALVESYARVEDVVPERAALALIGLDPRRDDDRDVPLRLRDLRSRCGDAPIGVVLACADATMTRAIAALGVAGVVRHDATLAVAIAAIQLMWVGGSYLPPDFAREDEATPVWRVSMADDMTHSLAPIAPMAREPLHSDNELGLTSREWDVLRILREGRQNKIIAFELGISESTVKVHLRNIMKKLHASNRTQVALGAISTD